MRKRDEKYIPHTIITERGTKITFWHPVLTPEERERREKEIKKAMCKLYEECMKQGVKWPELEPDKKNKAV